MPQHPPCGQKDSVHARTFWNFVESSDQTFGGICQAGQLVALVETGVPDGPCVCTIPPSQQVVPPPFAQGRLLLRNTCQYTPTIYNAGQQTMCFMFMCKKTHKELLLCNLCEHTNNLQSTATNFYIDVKMHKQGRLLFRDICKHTKTNCNAGQRGGDVLRGIWMKNANKFWG